MPSIDLDATPTLLPESEIDTFESVSKSSLDNFDMPKAPHTVDVAHHHLFQLFFEIDALGKKTHFSRMVKIGDTVSVGLATHHDVVLEHTVIGDNSFSIDIVSDREFRLRAQGPQAKITQEFQAKKDALVQLSVIQVYVGRQTREKISPVAQKTFDIITQTPSKVKTFFQVAILGAIFFAYFLFKTMTLGYVAGGDGGAGDLENIVLYTVFFSWCLDILFLLFFAFMLTIDWPFFRKYRKTLNQKMLTYSAICLLLYITGSIGVYALYFSFPEFVAGLPNLYNLWWVLCVGLFFYKGARLCLVSQPKKAFFKNFFIICLFGFWIFQNYGVQANSQSAWYPQEQPRLAQDTPEKTFEGFLTNTLEKAK